jgi:hypothetical protein
VGESVKVCACACGGEKEGGKKGIKGQEGMFRSGSGQGEEYFPRRVK